MKSTAYCEVHPELCYPLCTGMISFLCKLCLVLCSYRCAFPWASSLVFAWLSVARKLSKD